MFESPSEWDGEMEDGSVFYGRYRFGALCFYVQRKGEDGKLSPANIFDDALVFEHQTDDRWDSIMETRSFVCAIRHWTTTGEVPDLALMPCFRKRRPRLP